MFQIDLTTDGELLLHMPSGCAIEISATPGGLEYIKKVIREHAQGIRDQRGYIGSFPTQHAVDKFLKEKKIRTAREHAAANKEKANKLGIDLDRLEINL